jgi:hypothetical protein
MAAKKATTRKPAKAKAKAPARAKAQTKAQARVEKPSSIRIECRGADLLPLDAIEEFQGNLKKRSKADIEKIITSITKYGFSFPFFVWNGDGHNRCLDGHGRIQALGEMRRRGESLPLFPVSYVEAKDEAEAKQKLLRLNSQYGTMSVESVLEFMDGLEIESDELNLPSGTLEIGESKSEGAAKSESDEASYHEKAELVITVSGDDEAQALYAEFIERGLSCRISTL